jgi:hypothetical protein
MGSSGDGGVVVALCLVAVVVMATIGGEATLTTDFYDDSCPEIYSIVEAEVDKAVASEARLAASLLRLHFHDCFVNVSHSLFGTQLLMVMPISSTCKLEPELRNST